MKKMSLDDLAQLKRDLEQYEEESLLSIEKTDAVKSNDDWLAEIHEDFVARVTDTEVPLWMAEIYGHQAFNEPIDHESLIYTENHDKHS